jgi:hypothetical protein
MSQPPDDHLKALWQGQETENKPMSVDAIRARAARFTNLRRMVFLFGLVLMLTEIVIFGRFALILPGTVTRVGLLMILVGLGWMIARFSLLAPRRFPDAKASGETILEYHVMELQRRETFRSQVVMVGPLLLGAAIFVVGIMIARPRVALQAAPLLVLIGLWLVGAWWMLRVGERKRLRKLAEIEATRVEQD